MYSIYGGAAFLASIIALLLTFADQAAANGSRPIYGCFSPENAAIIGRLGANDLSVRYGFETGECMAFAPGVLLNDVERVGSLWRFRAFGATPYLYAADWAAGFNPSAQAGPAGFEQYIPVTARLRGTGRTFVECYDASVALQARFDDHGRRMRDYYESGSRLKGSDNSSLLYIIFLSDTGPKLEAEGYQLRVQAAALDRRCASVATIEADNDFLAFVRTARQA